MFHKGFTKISGAVGEFMNNAKKLDHAGLGLLALAPAYQGYKAIKHKDKAEGALAATELGGLGLLSRAVAKGH